MPQLADALIGKIATGEISPEKLNQMTSKERHAYFAKFLGDDVAGQTNALIESKLLLKNQSQGLVTAIKQLTGLKEPAKRDFLSRVQKMEKILSPEDRAKFFEDLAEQKLGFGVTVEEAGKIAKMAKKVEDLKTAALKEPKPGPASEAYADAQLDFRDYTSNLKTKAEKLTVEDFKKDTLRSIGRGIVEASGAAKAFKFSLDNSALLNQGLKTVFSSPRIWARNALKSFVDFSKSLGDKNYKRVLEREILSRKNAVNGEYAKYKIPLGAEDSYPSSLPERIPLVGRAFMASENAMKGFLYRMRADLADYYIDIAKKSGMDIKGLGEYLGALTGRSHLGRLEQFGDVTNVLFTSARNLKSHFDFLRMNRGNKDISLDLKRESAKDLLKFVGGVASIMLMANTIDPGSAPLNPTDPDFGKIKVGKRHFNITGGTAGLVKLAAIVLLKTGMNVGPKDISRMSSKLLSNTQERKTAGEIVGDFFSNRLAPLASMINQIAFIGKNREGEKLGFKNEKTTKRTGIEIVNALSPMTAQTAYELKNVENLDVASPEFLAAMIADALGAGVSVY